MSCGANKRRREITEAVESLGFTCLGMKRAKRNSHYHVRVRDDTGNVFKVVTACTAGDKSRTINNFKASVRRQSNQMKGLITQ